MEPPIKFPVFTTPHPMVPLPDDHDLLGEYITTEILDKYKFLANTPETLQRIKDEIRMLLRQACQAYGIETDPDTFTIDALSVGNGITAHLNFKGLPGSIKYDEREETDRRTGKPMKVVTACYGDLCVVGRSRFESSVGLSRLISLPRKKNDEGKYHG